MNIEIKTLFYNNIYLMQNLIKCLKNFILNLQI